MRIQGPNLFVAMRLPIAILVIWTHTAAMAAEVPSRAGHGRVTTSYHYVKGDGYESRIGTFDTFTTDSHALDVEVEYNLTDRWTVMAGVPYVMKRIKATPEEQALHDPALIVPPQNSKFIDDGKYRASLQDLRLGVRYLAVTSPIIIDGKRSRADSSAAIILVSVTPGHSTVTVTPLPRSSSARDSDSDST